MLCGGVWGYGHWQSNMGVEAAKLVLFSLPSAKAKCPAQSRPGQNWNCPGACVLAATAIQKSCPRTVETLELLPTSWLSWLLLLSEAAAGQGPAAGEGAQSAHSTLGLDGPRGGGVRLADTYALLTPHSTGLPEVAWTDTPIKMEQDSTRVTY